MPDATITAVETAAIPTAIAALQAVQQFNANMGTDPLKWAVNFPAAQLVLVGSLQLLLPSLGQAEGAALINESNAKISGWITTLQAKAAANAQAKPA